MADEKFDEKEMEKQEEKAPDEKWRRDPLGAIIWALILIWAGIVLLLDNMGYLNAIKENLAPVGLEWLPLRGGVWGLILLGAGVILVGEVLLRLLIPAYRRPVIGTIIMALVFIGIGLGNLVSWGLIWAVVLIAIGLSILVRGMSSRGK
jgi:hypothetical protein